MFQSEVARGEYCWRSGGSSNYHRQPAANCGGLFVTDVTNASRWPLWTSRHNRDPVDGSRVCPAYDTLALPKSVRRVTCTERAAVPPVSPVYRVSRYCYSRGPTGGVLSIGLLPGEAKNTYGTACS
jgi:hypothetical protein